MKLYHGFSAKDLSSIMTHGLRPRGDRQSNWEKNPSRPDMVYLTVAYPFYFAVCHEERLAGVVEIEARGLDRKRFFPDEDYLTNVRALLDGKDIDPYWQKDFREFLHTFGDCWQESIQFQGNCCYQGTIAPENITRYCIFDRKARPALAEEISDDPCLSLLNYASKGKSYRQLVAWMFGDRKVLPMVAEAKEQIYSLQRSSLDVEYLENARKMLAVWKEESRDRTGINVRTPGHERT